MPKPNPVVNRKASTSSLSKLVNRLSVVLFLLAFFVGNTLLAQQTHIVTNLNNSGAGSLRQVIAGSSNGDIVTFSPSLLANGSATITLTSEIGFSHGLTIKGLFLANDSLSISGGGTSSIFRINGSTFALPTRVFLEDLILEEAYLVDSAFSTPKSGAALFANDLEVLHIKNSVIRNNHVKVRSIGAGVYLNEVDSAFLSHCVFMNNSTDTSSLFGGRGGALRSIRTSMVIDSSIFKSNASGNDGGAISAF